MGPGIGEGGEAALYHRQIDGVFGELSFFEDGAHEGDITGRAFHPLYEPFTSGALKKLHIANDEWAHFNGDVIALLNMRNIERMNIRNRREEEGQGLSFFFPVFQTGFQVSAHGICIAQAIEGAASEGRRVFCEVPLF